MRRNIYIDVLKLVALRKQTEENEVLSGARAREVQHGSLPEATLLLNEPRAHSFYVANNLRFKTD